MREQRTFGRGVARAMHEAAQRRLKNPPRKPWTAWLFAAAAVFGVVARVVFLTGGPIIAARILITAAVVLAVAGVWLRLRRWWRSRGRS